MKRKLFIGLVFSAIAALCYSPPVVVAKDVGTKYQVEKFQTVATAMPSPEIVDLGMAVYQTMVADPAEAEFPVLSEVATEKTSKAVTSLANRRREGPCVCERCSGKGTALIHIDPGSIG